MSAVLFVVHGQPIPKARPRVVKGHSFTPRETLIAERAVAVHARAAGARPHAQPVHLRCTFYRSDARRCDIDNLVKTVQDALNGVAYDDDAQVVMLTASKLIDREAPRTVVEVSTCP